MKDTPVKTAMSPLEIAVWSAEYVRVRAGTQIDVPLPKSRTLPAAHAHARLSISSHEVIRAAIEAADRAIIDLREALGTEHLTLRLAELGEDHGAKLDVFREHLTKPAGVEFEKIDPDDHHMTWERFVGSCKSGSFIDYDGSGELATATHVSNVSVSPSEIVGNGKLLGYTKPAWATHVVWYNK